MDSACGLKGLSSKTKEQANNTTAEFQLIINQRRKLAERLQKNPRADYSVNHTYMKERKRPE